MKGYLNLVIEYPGERIFETPARQMILVGLWEKKLPDPGRFLCLPARQAIRLLAGYEIEGCCFVVEKDTEGAVTEIFAYRGPATAHEVYFSAGQNGGWIISNMFRYVLGSLPLSRRDISPEGFLDFLLFQHSPLPESPIGAIRRLGHGDLLHVDRRGAPRISTLSRLEIPGPPSDFRAGVDLIGKTLSLAVENLPEGVSNLLSGGIDSTLVQVLLGPGHAAVYASIDSPELAFEDDYATRAASLCGVTLQKINLAEREFPILLERETSLARLPLPLLQIPVISAVFDHCTPHFSSGFSADALFSLSRSNRELILKGADPVSFPVECFSTSSERSVIEEIFGKEKVGERICMRNEYVRSRVREPESFSGLNLGCLTSFYCNSFPAYRQLAEARGKTISSPFKDRQLVQAALSLPIPERILRRAIFKPALKDILSRRLPGYPLELKKGGSSLPRTRFCQNGPLRDYFRENPLPYFVTESKAGPVLQPDLGSSMTTFRCIAWSMWERSLKEIPREVTS